MITGKVTANREAVIELEVIFTNLNLSVSTANGSALVVFYSYELEKTQSKIVDAGGEIIKPIFSFPGGRRFHFSDPNGNEYAVWSDVNA